MQILQTLVLILFFLVCAILIFLVMIQSGKGGSVGIFGGGGSSSPLGASTMDVVTKATWWIAGIFFTLAILAAIAFADSGPAIGDTLEQIDEAEDLGPTNSSGAPGGAAPTAGDAAPAPAGN